MSRTGDRILAWGCFGLAAVWAGFAIASLWRPPADEWFPDLRGLGVFANLALACVAAGAGFFLLARGDRGGR